ncbi:hypothetical protein [Gudongella sp. SC589]|jgi:hypothetical protein|uniref:hypothetical protein n=1 Tax=Gudongella sp. SC589 TaxID=3385990 RepID=UPI003904B5B9
MKIKIKVKTLLMVLIVLSVGYLWAIPQSTLAIARYLDRKDSPRAELFYERFIQMDDSIEGRLDYAKSLVKSFQKFTIYQQGWGGGEETTQEDMLKAEQLLKEILEKDPSRNEEKLYIDAYRMLMDISIAKGDVKALKELIEHGERDDNLSEKSLIYNAYLHFVNREFEVAENIIIKLKSEGLDDPRLDILQAEIHLAQGNILAAKKEYKSYQNRDWRQVEYNYFASGAYGSRNFWLQENEQLLSGSNKITGRVTYEGEPMAFVEVYILNADGGIRIGGESYVAITDENGYFQTMGLADGLYDVGLGLDSSLLTDKVFQKNKAGYVELSRGDAYVEYTFRDTFEVYSPQPGQVVVEDEFTVSWENVPEAAYYTVEPVIFSNPLAKSGGSFRSPIEDINGEGRFVETSAHFRISDFRNQTGGMTFEGEEWILGSGAVLGKFLPGGEYPIIVNAYDSENLLITSSFPMRTYYDEIPSIMIEGELSEGQELVAKMMYPEAILYYENVLKDDPDNVEAVSSLVKIYGIGWKKGEKNLEKAFRLIEGISDERLKADLLNSTLSQMDTDEILEFEKQVSYGIEVLGKVDNDNSHYNMYKLYLAKEDYREARNALENLENFLPDSLVFLHIYLGDYDLAVQRLLDDRFYPSRLQGEAFRSAILGLGENPPPDEEMEVLKEFLLEMVKGGAYERRNEIYNRLVNNVDNEDILTIVDEIYNERHWNY